LDKPLSKQRGVLMNILHYVSHSLCFQVFRKSEVVDVSHFSRIDSYYGLNLPAGHYRLPVVSDLNRHGFYEGTEVVGERPLSLGKQELHEKVLGKFDVNLSAPFRSHSGTSFRPATTSVSLAKCSIISSFPGK
jgi:hypothetical protein